MEIAFELLIIPARDDILKKKKMLCVAHNCHPCKSRRDIARLHIAVFSTVSLLLRSQVIVVLIFIVLACCLLAALERNQNNNTITSSSSNTILKLATFTRREMHYYNENGRVNAICIWIGTVCLKGVLVLLPLTQDALG